MLMINNILILGRDVDYCLTDLISLTPSPSPRGRGEPIHFSSSLSPRERARVRAFRDLDRGNFSDFLLYFF